MPEETFDVRDRRNGDWFWSQNLLLKAKLHPTVKLAYLALCSYANKNTESCYPTISQLAQVAGISSRSILRAITKLEKAKAIKIEKGKGRGNANRYTLLKLKGDNLSLIEKVTKHTSKRCQKGQIKGDIAGQHNKRDITNENNITALNKLRKKVKDLGLKRIYA